MVCVSILSRRSTTAGATSSEETKSRTPDFHIVIPSGKPGHDQVLRCLIFQGSVGLLWRIAARKFGRWVFIKSPVR